MIKKLSRVVHPPTPCIRHAFATSKRPMLAVVVGRTREIARQIVEKSLSRRNCAGVCVRVTAFPPRPPLRAGGLGGNLYEERWMPCGRSAFQIRGLPQSGDVLTPQLPHLPAVDEERVAQMCRSILRLNRDVRAALDRSRSVRSQQHQFKPVWNLVDAVLDGHVRWSLQQKVQFGEGVALSHDGAGNSRRPRLRAARPKPYSVVRGWLSQYFHSKSSCTEPRAYPATPSLPRNRDHPEWRAHEREYHRDPAASPSGR